MFMIKYFSIYGLGNFDLTIEEMEQILTIMFETKYINELDFNLKALYEKLENLRMG